MSKAVELHSATNPNRQSSINDVSAKLQKRISSEPLNCMSPAEPSQGTNWKTGPKPSPRSSERNVPTSGGWRNRLRHRRAPLAQTGVGRFAWGRVASIAVLR